MHHMYIFPLPHNNAYRRDMSLGLLHMDIIQERLERE